MNGAATEVIDRLAEPVKDKASVTWAVNVEVPVPVGVPARVPSLATVRPAGKRRR